MQECIQVRLNQGLFLLVKNPLQQEIELWTIASEIIGLPRELEGSLQVLLSVGPRSLCCTVMQRCVLLRSPVHSKDLFQNTAQILVF